MCFGSCSEPKGGIHSKTCRGSNRTGTETFVGLVGTWRAVQAAAHRGRRWQLASTTGSMDVTQLARRKGKGEGSHRCETDTSIRAT